MSGEELHEVKVLVPRDLIAPFYAMVGQWLVAPGDEDPPVIALKPWSENDFDRAATVWGKMSTPARALFGVLMENPGERISGEQLARDLHIANGRFGVAGVLAWPGRYCYAEEREFPVKWETGDYWMTPEVAALFLKARAGEQPEAN
jgi:hypothetical protein